MKYPIETKESVLAHGVYCESGLAYKQSATVAECVSIDSVYSMKGSEESGPLSEQLPCKADGSTKCDYRKDGKSYFKLDCECALDGNDDGGYCPIPMEK